MTTPIKSLLLNRSHLSPKSPRLLAPFRDVPQVKGEALSPLKLKTRRSLLSPGHCPQNVKGLSTKSAFRPEEFPILDSPHKRDLLNYGLNKHDLLYLLGRGSFGTVIKSNYKGNMVAVKLIKLENPSDQINESNACSLIHNNIIKILDVVSSKKYSLVIMEYYKNSKNLQQVLDEDHNALKEENVTNYSRDIAGGLKYCHDNKVLHLDIKPKNILVCEDGSCKICDFGNSVKQFDDEQNFRYQGTVAYTAPEILRGCRPTPKCDIYSLGILIWQLVSRKNPYEFLNNEVVIYKVVKFNFRPPLNFQNKYFSNLCKLCWNEDPDLRPSAAEVCHILDGGSFV